MHFKKINRHGKWVTKLFKKAVVLSCSVIQKTPQASQNWDSWQLNKSPFQKIPFFLSKLGSKNGGKLWKVKV